MIRSFVVLLLLLEDTESVDTQFGAVSSNSGMQ
jgi:hypothetical protein